MLKLFLYEVKRLFSDKKLLVISCLLPILLLLALSLSALPALFSGSDIGTVDVLLCNQDDSPIMSLIVNSMIHSDSIKERVMVTAVEDIETGKEMLEKDQGVCMVYIPEGFNETLYYGGHDTITYYYSDGHQQMALLIGGLVEDGIDSVNHAQAAVETVYFGMQKMGYPRTKAALEFDDLASDLFIRILARGNMYTQSSKISPFGEMLGLEFYSIALILLSSLISSIWIAVMMNRDMALGVFNRALPVKRSSLVCIAKWLAAALFMLVQLLVLIFSVMLINGSFWLVSGTLLLIWGTGLLISAYISALMLFLGTLSRQTTGTLWAAFSFSLLLCFVSGLILPSGILPSWLNRAAQATALPQIAQVLSYVLFGINYGDMTRQIVYTAGLSLALVLAASANFSRKLRRY